MARCSTRGPCAAVRRGRQAAQRASPWMDSPFRPDRSPVEKPGPDSRTCRAGARQAPSGVAFLFGYFLFGPRKEKVTRAPWAHESSSLCIIKSKGNSIARERAPTTESRAGCRGKGASPHPDPRYNYRFAFPPTRLHALASPRNPPPPHLRHRQPP